MKFKISEIVDFNSESIRKNDELDEIYYLDTANLTEGVFEEIKKYNWKEDKVPSRARRRVKENDILVSTVRPNQKHYGFITAKEQEYIVSTGFAVITPNTDKVDPYYLYQYLTLEKMTNYLQMIAENSTSAYPSIKPKDIGDLEIELPALNKQKQIGNFLWNINKKVHLNSSIISNLEELAQTLFKHWFVEFEFPNEEGKPYKSSGGKMVESELGMIPEGWGVTNIQSMPVIISDHVANGSFASIKKNVQIVEEKDYALFLRNTDLKQDLQGERRYVTKSSYEFLKKTQLFGGEVIISNVGDVGTIHRCPPLNRPMVLGNNLIVIQPTEQNEMLNTYFYFLFKSFEGKKFIKSITSGSVQMKFNKTDFRNLKIAIPEDFEKMNMNILNEILLKVDLLKQEIENLSKLRDSLLPKLLLGEIELPDNMEVTDDVPIS